jgi:hypothetical protein
MEESWEKAAATVAAQAWQQHKFGSRYVAQVVIRKVRSS